MSEFKKQVLEIGEKTKNEHTWMSIKTESDGKTREENVFDPVVEGALKAGGIGTYVLKYEKQGKFWNLVGATKDGAATPAPSNQVPKSEPCTGGRTDTRTEQSGASMRAGVASACVSAACALVGRASESKGYTAEVGDSAILLTKALLGICRDYISGKEPDKTVEPMGV